MKGPHTTQYRRTCLYFVITLLCKRENKKNTLRIYVTVTARVVLLFVAISRCPLYYRGVTASAVPLELLVLSQKSSGGRKNNATAARKKQYRHVRVTKSTAKPSTPHTHTARDNNFLRFHTFPARLKLLFLDVRQGVTDLHFFQY